MGMNETEDVRQVIERLTSERDQARELLGKSAHADHLWRMEQRDKLWKAEAEIERLEAELETERMRLVACMTASIQNTETSKAERLAPEHPYWSVAYSDVCRAVDREMAHREKLAAQPAPSGWQHRIERLVSEAFGAGVEWGGAAYADERPKWEGAKAMAENFIAECTGQNAVDALSSAHPSRVEKCACGHMFHGDGKCAFCDCGWSKALPPAPEVEDSKLSAIDPDTGSDEGMTPLCAYDTKRLLKADAKDAIPPQPTTNEVGDVVCQHGTAMDVHCCNCHSGFLFDAAACVCVSEGAPMCEHGTEVMVSVEIPADLSCDGKAKWKDVGIDACIAQIVKALQEGGVAMRGSCCGHGRQQGHIDLQDGRGLLILSRAENAEHLRRGIGERRYPCGCSAVGGPNLPAACPEHGEDAIPPGPEGLPTGT
jgi:hypothetical protein